MPGSISLNSVDASVKIFGKGEEIIKVDENVEVVSEVLCDGAQLYGEESSE